MPLPSQSYSVRSGLSPSSHWTQGRVNTVLSKAHCHILTRLLPWGWLITLFFQTIFIPAPHDPLLASLEPPCHYPEVKDHPRLRDFFFENSLVLITWKHVSWHWSPSSPLGIQMLRLSPVVGVIPVLTGQRRSYMCSRLLPPPVAIEESGLPSLFSHPDGKERKTRVPPAREERSFKGRGEGGSATGQVGLHSGLPRPGPELELKFSPCCTHHALDHNVNCDSPQKKGLYF